MHNTINQGSYALKSHQDPRTVILAFRGDYAFLSNFAPCTVILPAEGNLPAMIFNSTEQAYMAWKTLDLDVRKAIQAATPGEAKRMTHEDGFPLRPDYSDAGRLAIMLELNRQKYSIRNPELRKQLLATGHALLIEGNDWGDTFFGFSFIDGWGHNHLGRILMQIRDDIRAYIHSA
ncbi:MAG: DUF1768 domain-containing protein [Proteobacteria bacterium]|nr:DUF1768 domain-containing protein [Pseudomonadota bacterium]